VNVLEERARQLARAKSSSAKDGDSVELLRFQIAAERYALVTSVTHGVVRADRIGILPGAPEHFRGILNLQGEIVPLIDLSRVWRLERAAAGDEIRAVIVGAKHPEFALLIDAFDEIVQVAPAALQNAFAIDGQSEFVRGVLDDGSSLLDERALLDDPRFFLNPEPQERNK